MRCYAAVNANDQLVTISERRFQRCLLNAIAFREAMRHVEACRRSQHTQSAQQHRRAGGAVNVVIAVNKNPFTAINCAQQTRHGVLHPQH